MLILGIADQGGMPEYALVKSGDLICTTQDVAVILAEYPLEKIDSIAYFQKPFLALERFAETHLAHAPKSFQAFHSQLPGLLNDCLWKKRDIAKSLLQNGAAERAIRQKILFSDYVSCLCAQAFYPSSYEEAAILCLDGIGEWSGTAVAIGQGSDIRIEKEILYPHSLGVWLHAFADYLGTSPQNISGLAQGGDPTYARMLSRSVIDLKPDGSFLLNQFYFDYAGGQSWTSVALHDLLGGPPRSPAEPMDQRCRNIAASVMALAARSASLMVHAIAREYRGIHTLCVTGTVANEPMVREHILRDHPFDRVDISPITGNCALSAGAALCAYYQHHKRPRDIMFLQNLPTAAQK